MSETKINGNQLGDGNYITPYAKNNLVNGVVDTVYQATKPTLIVFGATVTQSDRFWFLDISTDGENFISIAGYKVQAGDPDSLAIFNQIIGNGLYWKVRTNVSGNFLYKYSSIY